MQPDLKRRHDLLVDWKWYTRRRGVWGLGLTFKGSLNRAECGAKKCSTLCVVPVLECCAIYLSPWQRVCQCPADTSWCAFCCASLLVPLSAWLLWIISAHIVLSMLSSAMNQWMRASLYTLSILVLLLGEGWVDQWKFPWFSGDAGQASKIHEVHKYTVILTHI